MKVDTQDYLRFVEATGNIVFVDIEATSLKADLGSTLCVSFKPYGQKPKTFSVKQVGNDSKLVKEVKAELEKYHCWVTYYGKGFDIPFLNTRLLRHGVPAIEKRHHLDLYFSLKPKLRTISKSLGHVGKFLGVPEVKMSVLPEVWADMPFKLEESMPKMISRCESDCILLEDVYLRSRHLIGEITV